MARPKKRRKIYNPPQMVGYRPFGIQELNPEVIRITYEEFESLKLVHYDFQGQEQAAQQMDVSRPTFTRIYQQALKQIIHAFVEGKSIEIEGGNYELQQDWYRCRKCHKLIEGLQNHTQCKDCPDFSIAELIDLNN